MGRTRFALAVVLMLATQNYLRAADGSLVNGGFEADDRPISDIRLQPPSGWDVNLPAGLFSGYVVSSEATAGRFALKLAANWFVTFAGGEVGMVSQLVSLDKVSAIGFDLKLRVSQRAAPWDPNTCVAVVRIDQDVVWQSDFARADIRGDYPDQVYRVDDKYRDGQLHRLVLGLKMQASGMFFEEYDSYWDAVECRAVADGNDVEFPPGDFNQDSRVNLDDMRMMAGEWLTEVPADSPYNLFTQAEEDAAGACIVNFFDWAVLARHWRAGPVPEP